MMASLLRAPVYYAEASSAHFLARLFYCDEAQMVGGAGCRRDGASAAFDRLNKYSRYQQYAHQGELMSSGRRKGLTTALNGDIILQNARCFAAVLVSWSRQRVAGRG